MSGLRTATRANITRKLWKQQLGIGIRITAKKVRDRAAWCHGFAQNLLVILFTFGNDAKTNINPTLICACQEVGMSYLSLAKTELFSVYEFTDKPQLDPHIWLEDILGKTALTWVCSLVSNPVGHWCHMCMWNLYEF